MTVSELIKELKKYHKEADVYIATGLVKEIAGRDYRFRPEGWSTRHEFREVLLK